MKGSAPHIVCKRSGQNAKPHPPCFERTHQHHQFAMNLQKLQRLHHAGMLTGPRQTRLIDITG